MTHFFFAFGAPGEKEQSLCATSPGGSWRSIVQEESAGSTKINHDSYSNANGFGANLAEL